MSRLTLVTLLTLLTIARKAGRRRPEGRLSGRMRGAGAESAADNRGMETAAFVILREDGQYFEGPGWTPDRRLARRFDRGADAWADCHLAVTCLRRLGHRCSVVGIPFREVGALPKVAGFELPGAQGPGEVAG